MYDTAKPYIASYLLIRKEGKIAFVLRSNTNWMSGYYGLPSGKVEQNETFTSAAIREAHEEIGISISPDKLKYLHTMHRIPPDEDQEWVDVFFEAREYEGEVHNAEPDVHSSVEWFGPGELPENVISSVRYAIEMIENGEYYSEFTRPEET